MHLERGHLDNTALGGKGSEWSTPGLLNAEGDMKIGSLSLAAEATRRLAAITLYGEIAPLLCWTEGRTTARRIAMVG